MNEHVPPPEPKPISELPNTTFSPCCGAPALHPAVMPGQTRFCERCGDYYPPENVIDKAEAERLATEGIIQDPEYGEEVEIKLANGRALRTPALRPGLPLHGGSYVRVVDKDGQHVRIWHADQWQDDSVMTMAAILQTAEGQRRRRWR